MTYTPIPDSVAGRAVAYLRSVYPQRIWSAELERAIGAHPGAGLHACLRYAIDAGLICMEKVTPRRVVWWSPVPGPLEERDYFGPPLEEGYGSNPPGRELAQAWGMRA